jgi:hypothetical protein
MSHYVILTIAALMITSAIWFARWLWVGLVAMQDDEELPQRSRTFFSRQFRRRIQIAAMIGLSGVFLVVTALIPPQQFPKLFVFFGSVSILLLLWSILIAVIDVISINIFFGRSRHWGEAQRTKLKYEIEKHLREMKNKTEKKDEPDNENESKK